MSIWRMIFQPVATLLHGNWVQLSRGNASGDCGIVNLDDGREICFARVANLHLTFRWGSDPRFFRRQCRAHAAGKNALSKVGWNAPAVVSPIRKRGLISD